MIYFAPLRTKPEWQWFKERTHVISCEDTQGIVAYRETGCIAGMVVFDTWTDNSANVHLAIDDPTCIRRGLLREAAIHAYHVGGKKRLFGLVPSNNAKALRLNKKIGFREVARVPDAIDDGIDYVVMRLDKEECRWLPALLKEAS